jgi:N-methylhydantoinase A
VRPLSEVGELPGDGEADLRYRGQSFELTVPLGPGLADRFHRLHEERYGYADRGRELELVAVRTVERRPGPELILPADRREAAVGPAVVELDGATCWLPPGWVGVRDGGIWRLTRA